MNDRTIIGIDTAKSSFALARRGHVRRHGVSEDLQPDSAAAVSSPAGQLRSLRVSNQRTEARRRLALEHLHRLTEIEAVFRALKSELGLRPIVHQKSLRAKGTYSFP